jgi:hypothetical protein
MSDDFQEVADALKRARLVPVAFKERQDILFARRL